MSKTDPSIPRNILKISSQQKKELSYLKSELDAANIGKKIKIRSQKNKHGYHLYLDYAPQKDKRQREFLNLHVADKKCNETINILQDAILARERREIELFGLSEIEQYKLKKEINSTNFVDYFRHITLVRKQNNVVWKNTLKHLSDFTGSNSITFSKINKSFCKDFIRYLQENVSQNSTHTYFSKFKRALNEAVEDEIIETSPANGIIVKQEEVIRVFNS